ncbi:hypothetical protein [Tritonibacter horizontis]|uniref:Ribosome association toxin RatA n=1 Tax=Tritonibacter horizontis TaxID=1768241 RepID=A0A132BYK9_9RHOB|nr:hypothetical protein [Tritonibacter horizontis]KUP93478.1 hypothetical protein TRIHO_16870 [Tritonibacter horizontis]
MDFMRNTLLFGLLLSLPSTILAQQSGEIEVSPEKIISRFECKLDAPLDNVFQALADVENHSRILSNIVNRTVVSREKLSSVLKENEVLTVSTVVEPEERIAFALFRLFPPNRVEEEMLTDPFFSAESAAVGPQDRKKGSIYWDLTDADGATIVEIYSEFAPRTGRVYTAERVNRIWSSHCELLQADALSR